jgi:hypothetical protein
MLTTYPTNGPATRTLSRAIGDPRWVAIQIEAMDARLARLVNGVLGHTPGVITVRAEPDRDGVVITFDPAVMAPGALADMVARISAPADRSVSGAVTGMRTGPLTPLDLMEP